MQLYSLLCFNEQNLPELAPQIMWYTWDYQLGEGVGQWSRRESRHSISVRRPSRLSVTLPAVTSLRRPSRSIASPVGNVTRRLPARSVVRFPRRRQIAELHCPSPTPSFHRFTPLVISPPPSVSLPPLRLPRRQIAELKKELKDRGLPTSGNKSELAARLKDALAADGADSAGHEHDIDAKESELLGEEEEEEEDDEAASGVSNHLVSDVAPESRNSSPVAWSRGRDRLW